MSEFTQGGLFLAGVLLSIFFGLALLGCLVEWVEKIIEGKVEKIMKAKCGRWKPCPDK